MTRTNNHSQDGPNSFDTCLSEWTSREMQLVRLHEEILSRREALISCSVAYHQSQETCARKESSTADEAYLRNNRLLQDIRSAQDRIDDALNISPTPRFMTLQKNYWAMVKSQVPLWEEELGIQRPSGRSPGRHSEQSKGPSSTPRKKGSGTKRKQTRIPR